MINKKFPGNPAKRQKIDLIPPITIIREARTETTEQVYDGMRQSRAKPEDDAFCRHEIVLPSTHSIPGILADGLSGKKFGPKMGGDLGHSRTME